LWPAFFRKLPTVPIRRERFELDDGDFLDLSWASGQQGPVVILLHGLEGSFDSHYARGLLHTLTQRGFRAVLMHFRGCNGEPNRLPRSYHSGETGDIAYVVRLIKEREPDTPVAAVGFSLGGNALLKWLGETGKQNPLTAAVAVSVPFELACSADRLEHGFSRLYQYYLINKLKTSIKRKFSTMHCPVDISDLAAVKTFRQFDDRITAPLHGFSGVDDYYALSSSRQYIKGIGIPTLILHARDDPFMTPACIPHESELSPTVTLELNKRGGHVGFTAGSSPLRPIYWLEQRITGFLHDSVIK